MSSSVFAGRVGDGDHVVTQHGGILLGVSVNLVDPGHRRGIVWIGVDLFERLVVAVETGYQGASDHGVQIVFKMRLDHDNVPIAEPGRISQSSASASNVALL